MSSRLPASALWNRRILQSTLPRHTPLPFHTGFERLGAPRVAERCDNEIDCEAGLTAWIEPAFAGMEKTESAIAA